MPKLTQKGEEEKPKQKNFFLYGGGKNIKKFF
jgi:hypothetical protein